MRVVVQRVKNASVCVDEKVVGAIDYGLLILLGITQEDGAEDIEWLCRKIAQMRIFGDENDLMNKSLLDIGGEVLIISQFTLHASTKKGNRPSFIAAAKPEQAIPLYEQFITAIQDYIPKKVQTGIFGADMKVNLLNDGPVTITMDSKNRE
ncbi:MAG: D-tyrosyl-tRNA(Tyr) deacylase [Flavobacteriaceae bacterium]|nr:D-tyrosyl-tRNA(Tyr) deacylase [Flavobacteriaceae bacterium]